MKAATPTAPDIESPVDGYELFPFATARLSSPTGDMSITQYSYLFFNEATKMFLKDNETGQLVVEKITVTTESEEAILPITRSKWRERREDGGNQRNHRCHIRTGHRGNC